MVYQTKYIPSDNIFSYFIIYFETTLLLESTIIWEKMRDTCSMYRGNWVWFCLHLGLNFIGWFVGVRVRDNHISSFNAWYCIVLTYPDSFYFFAGFQCSKTVTKQTKWQYEKITGRISFIVWNEFLLLFCGYWLLDIRDIGCQHQGDRAPRYSTDIFSGSQGSVAKFRTT